MSALHRILRRDLLRLRGEVVSIALVVACGVAVFVTMATTYQSLQWSQRAYFADARFADVFASLDRAPASLERRLAAIDGVAAVETRIVKDVSLDLAHTREPAGCRLVSIPDRAPQRLNLLHVRRGRAPSPDGRDEVLVSEAFANANELGPGDSLVALLSGRRQALRVVGVALSPEYVYAIRPGDLMPDDAHFGVLWMNREALAAAFDLTGAFNDVVVKTAPGARLPDVVRQMDALLAPYGGLGAYGRDEQVSTRFVTDELGQLDYMARVLPAIFLGVAAFLVNVVLGRIVETQRTQIATLKALGYSSGRIARHYLELVVFIVALGAVLGSAFGAWLGSAMTELYTAYFRFPVLAYRFDPVVAVAGAAVSLVAAATGALASVARAARLPPAEAMQPAAPIVFERTLLDRLGVQRLLPQRTRMILRDLGRRPLRAALAIVGIAFSAAILIGGSFSRDSLDLMIDLQFEKAQREDATVAFNRSVTARARHELEHVPGIRLVEGARTVPVILRHGPRSRRTAIFGFPEGSRLHELVDLHGRRMDLPTEGIVLSASLGKKLDARAGDLVDVELLEGERVTRSVPVAALLDDLLGLSAYMGRPALARLARSGDTLSAAWITFDPRDEPAVTARLQKMPGVAVVTVKRAMLRSFEKISAESMLVSVALLTGFAAVVAVGVVYNSARIALAERARELASLRVLGFTRREISSLLLGELGIQLVLGIALGLVLGYGLAAATVAAFSPDAFRIPLVVEPRTYAMAALVVFVAGAASALVVRRRLDRLDLVAVLKTRE